MQLRRCLAPWKPARSPVNGSLLQTLMQSISCLQNRKCWTGKMVLEHTERPGYIIWSWEIYHVLVIKKISKSLGIKRGKLYRVTQMWTWNSSHLNINVLILFCSLGSKRPGNNNNFVWRAVAKLQIHLYVMQSMPCLSHFPNVLEHMRITCSGIACVSWPSFFSLSQRSWLLGVCIATYTQLLHFDPCRITEMGDLLSVILQIRQGKMEISSIFHMC